MEDPHQHHGGHHESAAHSGDIPTLKDAIMEMEDMGHHDHQQQVPSHHLHDGMMMMYFHGGYNETILFYGWTISNVEGLIGSMVGIFFMGILYEALRFYRELHMRQSYSTAPFHDNPGGSSSSVNTEVTEASLHPARERPQTLLQLIQVVLSYFLMLIFMTYNSWLCGAVTLGLTVGYFLFGWKKPVVLVGDHCH